MPPSLKTTWPESGVSARMIIFDRVVSTAGFADQSEAFALADEKADIVDRQYLLGFSAGKDATLAQRIGFGQPRDPKQRLFKFYLFFFALGQQVTGSMLDFAQHLRRSPSSMWKRGTAREAGLSDNRDRDC